MVEDAMRQIRRYVLWAIVPVLPTGYIAAIVANPAWWTVPAGAVTAIAGVAWQGLTYPLGIPGWGWLLIALPVAGLVWLWIRADRRAEARSVEIQKRDQQAQQPIVYALETFDVRILYTLDFRTGGSGLTVIGIWCRNCRMQLQREDMAFSAIWHCEGCGQAYPNVPANVSTVAERLRGHLRQPGSKPIPFTPEYTGGPQVY